jgi:hypothetical protein
MNALPKICAALAVVFIGSVSLWAAPPMPRSWPDQWPVPTEAAAISIAIQLWSPIYGADHIAKEKPYHATLKRGVWTVMGSIPREAVGGAAVLKIRQSDGKVLLLSHYR